MGLDTFASRAEDKVYFQLEDLLAFMEADIHLGEWCRKSDRISFCGDLYSDLLFQVTGWSLWAAWTPPDRVKEMHTALLRCNPEEEIIRYNWDARFKLSIETVLELRKFFQVCAEQDLGLIGDW